MFFGYQNRDSWLAGPCLKRIAGLTLFVLFSFSWFTLYASEPVLIHGDESEVHVHPFMEVLVDTDGSIPLSSAIGSDEFKPYQRSLFSQEPVAYWIRFTLNNESSEDIEYSIITGFFDSTYVYVYDTHDNAALHKTTSAFVDPNPRFESVHRTGLLSILVPIGSSEYYLRVTSKTEGASSYSRVSLSQGFDLLTEKRVSELLEKPKDYALIIMGAMLIMFFFNMLISLLGNEKAFLWLGLYNLAFAVTILNMHALFPAFGIQPDLFTFQALQFILPFVLVFTNCFYALYFLDLKKHAPRSSKVLVVLNLSILPIGLLYFLGLTDEAVYILAIIVLCIAAILYPNAIRLLLKGHDATKYFLVGSVIVFAFFLNFLHSVYYEHRNYYQAEMMVLVAGLTELTIFTYGTVRGLLKSKLQAAELAIREKHHLKRQAELTNEMEDKSKELVTKTTSALAQRSQLTEILAHLNAAKDVDSQSFADNLNQAIIKLTRLGRNEQLEDDVLKHFNGVHTDFTEKLCEAHPNLTANEIKLCAYIRMNLSSLEIAQLQGVEKASINQARYRLRKKLEIDGETDLLTYLSTI